jgi:hypothetical protein
MIVAVIAMMTMQASLVDVIQVIAVRHPRVVPVLGGPAIVEMTLMFGAPMVRRAAIGVLLADLDAMGLNAVSPLMFQPIINQVVHVVTVTHGRMPATGTVSMCHCPLLSRMAYSLHHAFREMHREAKKTGPRRPVSRPRLILARWVREIRHPRAEYSGKPVIRS